MNRARFYLRLEPTGPAGDPQRGFAAELADPAWMVGRQWQMGEHQGENASSPLEVELRLRHAPIEPMSERPTADPQSVPTEAIVEKGRADWWTVGRRIRLGIAAQRANLIASLSLDEAGDVALRFQGLTGPYEPLNGTAYDGFLVYEHRPNDPVFAEVPGEKGDLWRSDAFVYRASFPSGGATLVVGGAAPDDSPSVRWSGHDGGDIDWWSVDSVGTFEAPMDDAEPEKRWPDRFRWPGGPAARWWQVEDHVVDLGGLPPDRAHLATTMLLDLLCGHADDWFLLPVPAKTGHVLEISTLQVTDSFGECWPAEGTAHWAEDPHWALFRVEGLSAHQLPIWLTATGALSGAPIDEIVVGVDEDTNLVWAVEERLGGKLTDRTRPEPEPPVVRDDTQPRPAARYRYAPATSMPEHWYPYTREDTSPETRYVQGRLLAVDEFGIRREAKVPDDRSPFLASVGGRPHEIVPWRLPPTGVRLETRSMLAREMSGRPVLWVQRRRLPLLTPPASGMRFDALIATDDD